MSLNLFCTALEQDSKHIGIFSMPDLLTLFPAKREPPQSHSQRRLFPCNVQKRARTSTRCLLEHQTLPQAHTPMSSSDPERQRCAVTTRPDSRPTTRPGSRLPGGLREGSWRTRGALRGGCRGAGSPSHLAATTTLPSHILQNLPQETPQFATCHAHIMDPRLRHVQT